MEKMAVHMKLTTEAVRLLDLLAQRRGLNRTAYLETLIRDEAARQGEAPKERKE